MNGPMASFLCVDLETTGLSPKLDKIMEIGAVRVENGEPSAYFETFVRPGVELPEKIRELTGITEADVRNAPAISEVLPAFLDFAGQLPLLGHRVLFDYSFLKRAAVNAGFTFERTGVDTLKIARKYLPELPGRRLPDLCAHYKIQYRAHRALEDAKACCALYRKLCEEFYQEEDFCPAPLVYKVKREGPATRAQKERLSRLLLRYNINPGCEIGLLTKNEASRLIDRILASYGTLQK